MNRFSIQAPAKKPRSIPWTALISIVVLGALVAAVLIPAYGDYADRGTSWVCRAGTVPEKSLPFDCRTSR